MKNSIKLIAVAMLMFLVGIQTSIFQIKEEASSFITQLQQDVAVIRVEVGMAIIGDDFRLKVAKELFDAQEAVAYATDVAFLKQQEALRLQVELLEVKGENAALKTQLANALISEPTVAEAVTNHVIEPTTQVVKEAYVTVKNKAGEYEFKPAFFKRLAEKIGF